MKERQNVTNAKARCLSFGGRKLLLVLIDIICLAVAYGLNMLFAGLSSKADHLPPKTYILSFVLAFLLLIGGRFFFSVYRNVWRYPNVRAYTTMVISDAVFGGLTILLARVLPESWSVDIGFWQFFCVLCMFDLITLLNRFSYQLIHQRHNLKEAKNSIEPASMNKIGVAIVGAGQIGTLLAEELTYNTNSHYRPVCFIDRDPAKIGARINGLPVYGEGEETIERLKDMPVQEIFIALPAVDSDTAAEMHELYSRTGCKVKLYDYPIKPDNPHEDTENTRRTVREIRIEDLLFRNSLVINNEETRNYYCGKTVLVTGGGGSIGSELCRQVAKCKPARLIILDIYENNAYTIQQYLVRKYGDKLNLAVEIASVRDVARLDSIFNAYRPDVVFHAAAHKHVPLMEHSSCEAIKNNVIGTYNTANMAEKYGVKKFILVSTDKAVNPTNIMGASKRMCEMVVQCRNDGAGTTSFSAVRFGNVLGSNGSVIPLFREQIAKGGPLTITDKRIIRYFMTIPEASQLVMQAGAMAKSGELFVLDMGKPVRILDLAENMIRLSGLRPYKDIDIVEVGLRPGEKLYEELLMKSETLTKTDNSLIFVEKDTPFTRAQVEEKLTILREAVEAAKDELESPRIKAAMKAVVPTYHDPEEVNQNFDASEEKQQADEKAVETAAETAAETASEAVPV